MKEAVTISKLSSAERDTALALAQRFVEQAAEHRDLRAWLQRISLDDLKEWLPSEPVPLLRDLHMRLHSIRQRDWTLRKEGQVIAELAGWHAYGWQKVKEAIRGGVPVKLTLRPEPENIYDRFAVAVDANWDTQCLHIGYIPAAHSEEVSELLDWGREIEISIQTSDLERVPHIMIRLLPVG